MASSLCRRIYHSFLSQNPNFNQHQSLLISAHRFSTETSSDSTSDSDSDPTTHPESDSGPLSQSSDSSSRQKVPVDRPLENGLDAGIYKAILIGVVGQHAIEKKLRSGRAVTMLSIGTGGMRNNRRPLQNEEPRDYANRSMVQWHRVSIYAERLGALVAKNAVPGSTLYLEGNLETKIFNDPITGLTRRVREVAVRGDGRVVFLDKGNDGQEPQQAELKGVGYY
ncbi:putative primosome PriB/single-strand DNA-binding, nucleic acid-binding protein [Helianthus annuus]|uniref:Primosome PriB/single-strand DNA-binding, nucleic acid-binding protein n=1 Tax=Helianthus annuus TaxID=4232 RepID=A0A251RW26_HELAN|nr:single-stranded DNA-binding protein, mitochondrial [Helianthus annuus]KAF5758331.1 putative primosome PriB/single-strand DNA-binding, nucleic acid-binding protein [Helianthus annuus]KAJ0436691.1 putative primosome PriB/single-strand DNA-binding, nucleic acid-binding protein [Helianthus annuus]KAJ0440907.1 putative primosome PriB/single-strand DNA-binding, nucleic acid-binding protein [Helianthus annuus]KAJ0458987.1 putative primosome PriB/single-strand DNA-binding, nucleic acid-binding prote